MDLIKNSFDYSVFNSDTREFLKVKESLIKTRTNQAIIENGRDLLEVKMRLPKKESFISWVESSLGIRKARAYEYIRIAESFGESTKFVLDKIRKSALILLSAPSVSEDIRQEALDRAESGEAITHKLAKELKEKDKRIKELESGVTPNLGNLIPQLSKKYKGASITIGMANRLSVLDEETQGIFLSQLEANQYANKEKQAAMVAKLSALEDLNKISKERDAVKKQLEEIAHTDTAQVLLDKEADLKIAKKEYERKLFEQRAEAEETASRLHERRFKDKIVEAENNLIKAQKERKDAIAGRAAANLEMEEMEKKIKTLNSLLEVDNPTNVDNARVRHIEDAGRGIIISLNELRKDIDKLGGGMEKSLEVANKIIKKATLELSKLQGSQDAIINI